MRLMGAGAPCCQGLLCGDGLEPRSAWGQRGRLPLLLPWPSTPCPPGLRRTGAVLPGVGAVAPGPDSTTPCAPRQGPDLPPAPAAPCRQAAPVRVRGQGSEWGSVSGTGINTQGWGGASHPHLPRTHGTRTPAPGTRKGLSKRPNLTPPQGVAPCIPGGRGGGAGPHSPGAIDRWGFVGGGGVVFWRPVPCPPRRDNCEARGNRVARPTPSNSSAV